MELEERARELLEWLGGSSKANSLERLYALLTQVQAEARLPLEARVLEEAAKHVPISYRLGWNKFWIECECGWNKDGAIAMGISPNPTKWAEHILALKLSPTGLSKSEE